MKEQARIAEGKHGFYTHHFSRQERCRLADLDDAHDLEGEITLLRVLIRRRFAGPPIETMQDGGVTLQVDVKKISRYVETLCRAIKTSRSIRDTSDDGMSNELKEILDELRSEQEAAEPTFTPTLPAPGPKR